MLTGGGSGGHITPLIAVATELKRQLPDAKVVLVGQRGDPFGARLSSDDHFDESYFISAGKFRRYHNNGLRWLIDVKTFLLNARDFFKFIIGIVQSWRLLRKVKPDAIFIKGGFVGVPVGLAAAALKVPYLTHDSDALPGLANRIISRWAEFNAVALPAAEYKMYPKEKIVTVGIPLRKEYSAVSSADKIAARKKLGFTNDQPIILLTGGGLGASRLNKLFVGIAPDLQAKFKGLMIVHQAGEKLEAEVKTSYNRLGNKIDQRRVKVLGYCSDLYNYSAAADVIVTRAGATTLAEFGAQHKPCVVVPNPDLTGGHQILNAEALSKRDAAEVVQEGKSAGLELFQRIEALLGDHDRADQLANNLSELTVQDSASKLSELLIRISTGRTS